MKCYLSVNQMRFQLIFKQIINLDKGLLKSLQSNFTAAGLAVNI